MHQPRKTGGQQLSCNNNFAKAVSAVVPNSTLKNQGLLFKEWIPLAMTESEWLEYVNAYFDACKTIDEERDEEEAEVEEETAEENNSSPATQDTEMTTAKKYGDYYRTMTTPTPAHQHTRTRDKFVGGNCAREVYAHCILLLQGATLQW